MQHFVKIFIEHKLKSMINSAIKHLFILSIWACFFSCQTAYYVPAYKQLPSYEKPGDINAALLVQQGYTAKGIAGFVNGAINKHLYTGYQYNKHFNTNQANQAFQSNYHEVIFGYYKNTAPKSMMSLDSSFMKASTIYGFHAGAAYQDWKSIVNSSDVFYAQKKLTFNKYFLQFSIGSKTKIYEGNYILYAAWYNLQTVNYRLQAKFAPQVIPFVTSNPELAAKFEKDELLKAKQNFIYGISYSGSLIMKDFRLLFNLNSPNSLGAIFNRKYLDFESVNVFIGIQYQLQSIRKSRKINNFNSAR
jgi:hypothetical protein